MSYTTISCVIVRCDGCGRALEFDTEETAHYPTRSEAAIAAAGCGWLISRQFQYCEACGQARTRCGDGGAG